MSLRPPEQIIHSPPSAGAGEDTCHHGNQDFLATFSGADRSRVVLTSDSSGVAQLYEVTLR